MGATCNHGHWIYLALFLFNFLFSFCFSGHSSSWSFGPWNVAHESICGPRISSHDLFTCSYTLNSEDLQRSVLGCTVFINSIISIDNSHLAPPLHPPTTTSLGPSITGIALLPGSDTMDIMQGCIEFPWSCTRCELPAGIRGRGTSWSFASVTWRICKFTLLLWRIRD